MNANAANQDPSDHVKKSPAPLNHILEAAGNTPLLRLNKLGRNRAVQAGPTHRAFVKLESFNPGGSAKDRSAHGMVTKALQEGALTKGSIVVESSSGNLGVALAREAALNDFEFHCVVDPRANQSTVAHMKALGATVHRVTEPHPETGDWLAARRAKVTELLSTIPGATTLDQYSNRASISAHAEGTMREITESLGHAPDFVFVAVSTTGTLQGCIQAAGPNTKVIAVDAEGSVLFDGHRGERHLPGFGAGVVPALSATAKPAEVMRVPDTDSVVAARQLALREAIMAGASSGAVVAAYLKKLPELHGDVVLVLHDTGVMYLDTIYDDDWVTENLGMTAEELQRKVEADV